MPTRQHHYPIVQPAQFLEKTILSVLSQNYANIEYIVIDGASTDASIDIIRKHANRLARWVSDPDAGLADAINKEFRIASGDIITLLNSDDVYFTRDAVRKVVGGFAAQPEAGVIYVDAATVDKLLRIRCVQCLFEL